MWLCTRRVLTSVLVISILSNLPCNAEDGHVLPSGRVVPIDVIKKHPFAISGKNGGLQLFEVSDHRVLSGDGNLSISLHKVVRSEEAAHHPDLRVSLNGQSVAVPSTPGKIDTGDGFEAMYMHGDDMPTEIHSQGMRLVPLHFGTHPGVYIARAPDNTSDEEGYGSASDDDASSVRATDENVLTVTRQGKGPRLCGAKAKTRYYEIAATFDNTLCALYDDNFRRALFVIENSIGNANAAFKGNLCVRAALVHVEAHCRDRADPIRNGRGQTKAKLLSRLQTFWKKNRAFVRRDLAIFFSGMNGWHAFRAASCSKQIGYAVSDIDKRSVAKALAVSLGAQGSSPVSGLVLLSMSTAAAKQVRAYLQSNGKSWCITTARRRCPAACSGRCIRGICIGGNLQSLPKCSARLKGNWQLQCAPYRKLTEFPTVEGTFRVSYALQFGRLYISVRPPRGTLVVRYSAMMVHMKLGSYPKLTEKAVDLRPDTWTYWGELADLPNPNPGRSCCGQKLHFVVKFLNCPYLVYCKTITRSYTMPIPCGKICKNGNGTPLPMNPARKCPVCKK